MLIILLANHTQSYINKVTNILLKNKILPSVGFSCVYPLTDYILLKFKIINSNQLL